MTDNCAVCGLEIVGAAVVHTSDLEMDDPPLYCSFDCSNTAETEGKSE